jgi:hypothetical protein
VQSQWIRRSTLNKHNNSGKKSEPTTKRAKPRDPARNQRQLAHCGRNIFWQADKKQGLSTSIASQCEKYLKGYPDFIARRCPKL